MKFSDYQQLTLHGKTYDGEEIIRFCHHQKQKNLQLLGDFMKDWLDDQPFIEVQTSGSTGQPKKILVKKEQMLQSAARTAAYFDFQPGDTALLCLPMSYIAGKMMVVRALLSHLNLYCEEPGNQPFRGLPKNLTIDFAPLVPTQLEAVEEIENVRKILLGGAVVSSRLEDQLQTFHTAVYHGYGMTETLSHIALRRVNGKGRTTAYKVLPGIEIETDQRNCLIISSKSLDQEIRTNDVVERIDSQHFIWKGRADFIINSGGIKFSPEDIEQKIHSVLSKPFFIAGLPDKKLGEKICLFIEGIEEKNEKAELQKCLSGELGKYERPKEIFFIERFCRTTSGKIKRKRTLDLV